MYLLLLFLGCYRFESSW